MDDKRLDELLHGLKDNYERLPEYTDTKKIVDKLPEKRKKRKRFVVIPLVAVFTGFLLFFILALPTVENYQNAAYSKDRLIKYAEERQEDFHDELGLDSIDDFLQQQDIQEFINTHKDTLNKEEFEEAKAVIDYYFTTPKSAMEALNNNVEEDRAEQWLSLSFTMGGFRGQLENYFQQLKIDHALDKEKQEDLYDNLDNYSGPIEIIEFLNLVEEQGYEIEKGNQVQYSGQALDGLNIRINYDTVLNQVEPIEQDEGMRRLLTLITEKMDIQNIGLSSNYDIPWYEYDDILLEFEEIYRSYPEDRELFQMYGNTVSAVAMYLQDFLSAGMVYYIEPVQEFDEAVYEEEIEGFVENHPDSIFWPLIATALEDYEKDNWPGGSNLYGYHMQFVLNTIDEDIAYNRLYDLHEWPISNSTRIYYTNYEKIGNLNTMKELSPFDFLSMYMYAASQDEQLHEELYAGEGEKENVNWQKMVRDSSLLVENYVSDEMTEFTLVSLENDISTNEYIAKLTLEYNDGWEVIKEEIFQ